MSELPLTREDHDVTCPHCKKSFAGELMDGSAQRYRGYKCPHCRLFVPLARADAQALAQRPA